MPTKNRITAAFLAFITGAVGGHKLYLNDTGGFIMYLVLFMVGVKLFGLPLSMILAIFEGLRMLKLTDQEFDRKYNKGYVQRGDSRIERRRAEQMRRYETEDSSRPYHQAPPQRQPLRVRANPFKNSGLAKYKEFDLDGAIEDFKKGLEIDPNDVALNFNIACAYSLTERKEEAYKHLAKAVSLGFNDFERIQTHDDLAFVRIQPEYDTFKKSGYKVYQTTKTAENTSVKIEVQSPVENNDALLDQLSRLAELKERGLLTEEEFLLEKKKLTRN
jgi:tetratricopeptide (TPR) repeat protein